MILDCFTFYNELDLLDIRFNELYESIDYFVLVEASKTQSFLDKPFYFEENKNRFDTFLDKIIHIKVTEYPVFDHIWGMENYQRNKIIDGLKLVPNISKTDIALISDVDEIPSKNSIHKIKNSTLECGSLMFDFRAYFLNYKAKRDWIGTVYAKAGLFNKFSPQDFRNKKDFLPLLEEGKINGWHLSWMGGVRKIWEKSFSCIEPFDKTKIVAFDIFEKEFNELIQRGSFIHLENLNQIGEEFYIEKDLTTLPIHAVENLKKYDILLK
jgi:beta-1,4-mannosyl-glycoprotein beta-1,4-N-acetylglucosaminyltransferase